MAQTNNNLNQNLFNKMLTEINQEISDMEEAERMMLAQGLSLADYSLPVATATVRKNRVAKEQAAQKDLPTTTINGEVVTPGGAETMSETGKVEADTSPYRWRDPFREELEKESRGGKDPRARNPYQQRDFALRHKSDKKEGLVAREEMTYSSEMLKDNPELRAYVNAYGEPEKVVQMINYDQKYGGKPERFLQPLPSEAQVKEGEPKLTDYYGLANMHPMYNEDVSRYYKGENINPLPPNVGKKD